MIKKLLAGMLITSSMAYATNSVEINVNDNTLEVGGEYSLNEIYGLNDDSQYGLTVSYLASERNDDQTDKLVSAGLRIMNPYINDNGSSFGMGIQVVWADNANNSFMAVPLNIFAKFELNEKINFDASGAYAPKILSFADSDGYTALSLKVNYKVLDNGYAYVGKRHIETKYDNNINLKLDDNLFFGYKVLF